MAEIPPSLTADTTLVTSDTTVLTADYVGQTASRAGWPCTILSGSPPSIEDRQSSPTADDLLPAVLALTPRGPAWGTDEAGNGKGASAVMLTVWRAIAAWAADINRRDFGAARQVFPSAVDTLLTDWEAELGLPDTCLADRNTPSRRLDAVRSKFGAVGGSSRDYLVCLAASVGYDITVDEPVQFTIDESECVDGGVQETYFQIDDGEIDGTAIEGFQVYARPGIDGDEVAGGIIESYFTIDESEFDDTPLESFSYDPNGDVRQFWIARVHTLEETWFRIDEGEIGFTPIEGFLSADDLECVLRRATPPHLRLIVSYEPAAA